MPATSKNASRKKRHRHPSRNVRSFDNIVLIGMPGAGKSSIGRALAKFRGMSFVDTDALIRKQEGKTLEGILNQGGADALWRAESQVLENLDCHNSVISTGGSAIYHDAAMRHLRDIGVVVMLDVPLGELKQRLGDLAARGVALRNGPASSVEDVYEERFSLYRRYAHVKFSTQGMGVKRSAVVLSHVIDNKRRHGSKPSAHRQGQSQRRSHA